MRWMLPACPIWGFVACLATGLLCVSGAPAQNAPGEGGTSAGLQTARSSVDDVGRATEWGESYQIRAFGQNPQARVMFSTFANDLRDSFRSSIYRIRPNGPIVRGGWTIPIAVELWGDARDVYIGEDVITSLELRADNRVIAKISVRLHDEFTERRFRLAVIEALLADLMLAPYGKDPSLLEGKDLEVPEWLVHGFDLYIEHRDGGRPSAFFEGILKSGQMLKPDELFEVMDSASLDPISYTIFRSSAGAMVAALIDQPEGDHALRALLGDLPGTGKRAMAPLLRQHFPAFREMDEGMEKWWALQVANFGQQQSFEFMEWDETEHWLNEALKLRWRPQDTLVAENPKPGFFNKLQKKPKQGPADPGWEGSLGNYAEFMERDGAVEKLDRCYFQLQALKRTGFPLYRPVIDRYCAVIQKVANNKIEGVDAELANLQELRGKIRNTLVQTSDYLNFFEATRAPERSKAFDEYSKMRRKLEEKPPPRRNDRITRYLDYLEPEFR